jgi:hypothetical protein
MADRLPKTLNTGLFSASLIRYIWVNYLEHKSGETVHAQSDRVVCGFPLPAFQRPRKWSRDQESKLIESIWLGLPIGSFTHQKMDWRKGGEPMPFSGFLLDGQQRLTAIQNYWEDQFPVFGFYFSELTPEEKGRFLNTKFSHHEVDLQTEDQLKELYDVMAYSGTAHEDHERASR